MKAAPADPQPVPGGPTGWPAAAALALLFTALTSLLELYCAYGDWYWTGATALHVASASLVALGLFLASLGLARALGGRASGHGRRAVLGLTVMHTLYWVVVRQGEGSIDRITIAGLLVYAAAAIPLACCARLLSTGVVLRGVVCVLAGGCAMHLVADWRYFDPAARVRWMSIAAPGWTALALAAAWAWSRWRRPLVGIGFALAVSVPLLSIAYRSVGRSLRPSGRGPHVLLVTCDTFRPDFTSAFGGATPTPNLERVRDGSVVFSRAYAVAPWTLPSFVGMFASRYSPNLPVDATPDEKLYVAKHFPVQPEVRTLAQQALAAGYTTCGISTNPWLNDQATGLLRGFDHGTLIPNGIDLETWGPLALTPGLQRALRRHLPTLFPQRPNDSSPHALRFAERFLREHRDEKVFLWVHFMDPHTPYDPPARYREGETRWPFFAPDIHAFRVPPTEDPHFISLDPEGEADAEALYRGELRYLDENVGTLLDVFDELGLAENGYVVLASDHGEELWEHGKVFHGQSLYEEQVRVLFTVRGPGLDPHPVAEPVSTIDLAPTLADLLALEGDPGWLGRSLLPTLRDGSAPAARPVFFNSTFVNAPVPMMGVVQGTLKLIRHLGGPDQELYDLEADPGELHPLGEEGADRARLLAPLISEMYRQHVRDLPLLSEEALREIEKLEALGYF